MTSNQLETRDLRKSFRSPQGEILQVLKGVHLQLAAGEMLAITGPSGSGKSTLLHIIGLMETPDAGSMEFLGQAVDFADEKQTDKLRRQQVGFLFQFNSLIEELTILDNLNFTLTVKMNSDNKRKEALAQLKAMAGRIGIAACLDSYPKNLSSGQSTRANILKSLAGDPALILMDEPTGNLDPKNAKQVISEFKDLLRQRNLGLKNPASMILVTHNIEIARHADRIFRLEEGRLVNGSYD